MIYLDAAFVAKIYLNEPQAERVRAAARTADRLCSCELARVEFASILHRHRQSRQLGAADARATWREFLADERNGVWQWLPINPALIEAARQAIEQLSTGVYLRAGDALHLACARLHGFSAIYSNDRHLLTAAPHFQLRGVDLTAG